MMTDHKELIERARARGKVYINEFGAPAPSIFTELADRIEELEAKLSTIRTETLKEAAEIAGVKSRKGGRPVSGPHHAGIRDGRNEAKKLILSLIKQERK